MSKQNFCQQGEFIKQQISLVTIAREHEEFKELLGLPPDDYMQGDDVMPIEGCRREVVSTDAKQRESSSVDVASRLAIDAEKYCDQENYSQAAIVMKLAIKLDSNIEYRICYGQYLFLNDEITEAKQIFANLLNKTECSDELKIIHLMYFITLCGLEKYDEARDFYKEYSIFHFEPSEDRDLREIVKMLQQDIGPRDTEYGEGMMGRMEREDDLGF